MDHAESSDARRLQSCAGATDRAKLLAELFVEHRERLRLMVELRLHPRLHARLGSSDVLQEAYLQALRRLDDYVDNPVLPLFLWLRHITAQKLVDLHREHLKAAARDARKEVRLADVAPAGPSAALLAAKLISDGTSPSAHAARAETKQRVVAALRELEPVDREILALRHFEQLSNIEAARVLGIGSSAASKRHERALRHLKHRLEGG